MHFFSRLIIRTISVILTSFLLPGVKINDFLTAIIVAFVLALLNGVLKPILILLTIPVTIVTFGLFLLVINALMILLASNIVSGFQVDGFWWALLFSIIFSIISSLLGINELKKRNQ